MMRYMVENFKKMFFLSVFLRRTDISVIGIIRVQSSNGWTEVITVTVTTVSVPS